MPNVSANIRRQLNVSVLTVINEKESYNSDNISADVYSYPVFHNRLCQYLKEGHKLGKIEPLFKRIMEADVKVWREKFAGVRDTKEDEAQKIKDSKKAAAKEKKQAKAAAAAANATTTSSDQPKVAEKAPETSPPTEASKKN
jgi:hypothetical protein